MFLHWILQGKVSDSTTLYGRWSETVCATSRSFWDFGYLPGIRERGEVGSIMNKWTHWNYLPFVKCDDGRFGFLVASLRYLGRLWEFFYPTNNMFLRCILQINVSARCEPWSDKWSFNDLIIHLLSSPNTIQYIWHSFPIKNNTFAVLTQYNTIHLLFSPNTIQCICYSLPIVNTIQYICYSLPIQYNTFAILSQYNTMHLLFSPNTIQYICYSLPIQYNTIHLLFSPNTIQYICYSLPIQYNTIQYICILSQYNTIHLLFSPNTI